MAPEAALPPLLEKRRQMMSCHGFCFRLLASLRDTPMPRLPYTGFTSTFDNICCRWRIRPPHDERCFFAIYAFATPSASVADYFDGKAALI